MVNKHYEAVHKYDFLTKELLQQEYVGNDLTDKQIAEKHGVSSKAIIWRKRKNFGIENKYINKSNQHAKKNRKFSISKEEAEQLLDEEKTFEEIAEKMKCSVIVAKRRFKELGLCRKQQQVGHYKFYDINLSFLQKQMVMGSVLGDGTITVSGAYSCSHSTKQLEYFNYKREVFKNLHSDKVHRYAHKYDNFNTVPESVHFTSGCNKYLYKLRDIYYPNGKKIFPYQYLMENMDEEGLSFWYCDDGGMSGNNAKLFTYGYSFNEQELFQSFFMEKFKLRVNIHGNKNNKQTLYFPIKDTHKFFALIRPYIIPSMRYKIGVKKVDL